MSDRDFPGYESDVALNYTCSEEIPRLKIGFVKQRDYLDFKLTGKYAVFNDQGVAILQGVSAPVKWRLKVENRQKAKYEYNILIGKYTDKELASEEGYKLIEKGIGAQIKTRGGKIYFKNKVINDNTEYWLVIDQLASNEEAHDFANRRLKGSSYNIIREKLNEPHGLFELFDNEFEKLGESENLLRIVPESSDNVTYVYDIADDHQEYNGDNYTALKGPIEFRCMDDGRITVICEIGIEEYVQLVIANQISANGPKEFLKALAVAVRSKVLANLCIKHHNEAFDVCAGRHCQTFGGWLDVSDDITQAVRDTYGVVIKKKNRIVEADYTEICGGYTESFHLYSENKQLYSPIFDGGNKEEFKKFGDLTQIENLKKWTTELPEVYCNPDLNSNYQVPNFFRNYFRWKITFDREELEQIINQKIGKKIGMLYDIIPVSRGISGRMKEVEILASDKNLILSGESEIREALSDNELPSTCFIVEPLLDDEGFPVSFSFYGAGAGHGVGLCQSGAITMALNGSNYDEILKHYYRGTMIKKIYEE